MSESNSSDSESSPHESIISDSSDGAASVASDNESVLLPAKAKVPTNKTMNSRNVIGLSWQDHHRFVYLPI